MLALVQRVLTNHVNPNGNPIKATFFVSLDSRFDGAALQHLYADGHEIAVHTMSHLTTTNSDPTRWHQEIAGDRRVLAELGNIPVDAMVGFRAPYLLMNDHAFAALAARGFLYDSSFAEGITAGSISTSPAAMIWPYTLHNKIQQVAPQERIALTNYPSLFEIPIWDHFPCDTNLPYGNRPVVMDPPDFDDGSSNATRYTAAQVDALWKTNFTQHYNGNRAPFGLFLHATSDNQWLSRPGYIDERVDTLNAFITWAAAHPDTWFITCRDLVNFMRTPVSASDAATNSSFLTLTNAYYTNATSCTYPDSHTFKVCGDCLPAAPRYTNAYYGLVPLNGGSVNFTVSSQRVSYADCSMLVSNTTTNAVYNWQASFMKNGGSVIFTNYDVALSQTVTSVQANAKQYNKFLAPGGSRTFYFMVTNNGAVILSNEQIALFQLGPSDITLSMTSAPLPSLQWTDNAHEYSVEWSSNLEQHIWATATSNLFLPIFTNSMPGPINPLFYRVKGVIY
jgi:peptidoglycan/xylan/chitin deacetylase (PgdA/CDA1 family)